eukprot:813836_1
MSASSSLLATPKPEPNPRTTRRRVSSDEEEESDDDQNTIRKGWSKGDTVEVYSKRQQTWFKGTIIDIGHDQDGEFLSVQYVNTMKNKTTTKDLDRYAHREIRPIMKERTGKTNDILDVNVDELGIVDPEELLRRFEQQNNELRQLLQMEQMKHEFALMKADLEQDTARHRMQTTLNAKTLKLKGLELQVAQEVKPDMTHQQREMGTQRSMPYFAQITQITNEAFVVRLDVVEMNRSKRRQYDIREINKPNADELERITIPRKSLFGTKQVYFDDDGHGEKYALGVFDRDKENPQLLSNIIHIVAHPSNAEYPPTQYKPKAVDVSSIKKVLEQEHQTVYLYWNVPALSLGDIEYKIIYNPNDDEKDNAADVKDDIVHVLPHSIPLELLPIQIQIITMCKFDKATFYSEPSDTIDIGNLSKSKPHTETTEVHQFESAPLIPDQTNPTAPSVPEIGWDVMPHYFMQIVSVDEDEFSIKLIPNKLDAKKRKFVIRDWIQSDVKKQIKINKNKESGTTDIRIDEDHADVYQL